MSEQKKERLSFNETLGLIRRSIGLSFRVKSPVSLLISLAGFGLSFLPALTAVMLARLTDQLQISYGSGSTQKVLIFLAGLYVLFILKILYRFLRGYFTGVDSVRTTEYIKRSIMEKCCRIEYSYLENEADFNDKLYFVEEYGGERVAESMQTLILCGQDLVAFISLAVVVADIHIGLLLLLLATGIPAVLLSIAQNEATFRHRAKFSMDGNMLIHYFLIACGDVRKRVTMPEFRFLQMYPYMHGLWEKKCKGYLKDKNAVVRKHVAYNCLADLLRNAAYVVVLFIAAKTIIDNPVVGIGLFTLLYSSTTSFQDAASELFLHIASFQDNLLYIRNFFEVMDMPEEKRDMKVQGYDRVEIDFDDVVFRYPGSEQAALDGLTLHVRAGEKIAIVGENGSGKSTFINLLTGMFPPTSGTASINGSPITKQLDRVRRSVSVVFQDFGRYETTLRDNITVSDRDREASDEELLELMKKTNSYSVYEEQPKGLDEIIGTFNKEANNLSGGQWQKVALTRAAYRKDAALMILDEPTAALDPVSETKLYQDFAAITGDRTTILISHRLGIAAIADRILVFDRGKIVEDGSHEELLKKDGLYAKMFRAQAQWYQ